jgi:hypothetical protein
LARATALRVTTIRRAVLADGETVYDGAQ